MAWFGQPLTLSTLLLESPHGIVDQALHARMGAEPTNGDGFGIGWYDGRDTPGVYRNVAPAWSDPNLRELAAHVTSPLFLAHVRAAIGSPVQATNCHPFRHGRWLFVHNGYIERFAELRRDLMLLVRPDLFAAVQGSTDTEVLFHVALTLGLEDDPLGAMERTLGAVEDLAARQGISEPVQGSFGISDGETLWAVRYASSGQARSLFVTADVDTIRRLHPDNTRFAQLGADDRLVVSEPFSDLPGVWDPVPESTALRITRGGVCEHIAFAPRHRPSIWDQRARDSNDWLRMAGDRIFGAD
jgi:glutamine amidotransferase